MTPKAIDQLIWGFSSSGMTVLYSAMIYRRAWRSLPWPFAIQTLAITLAAYQTLFYELWGNDGLWTFWDILQNVVIEGLMSYVMLAYGGRCVGIGMMQAAVVVLTLFFEYSRAISGRIDADPVLVQTANHIYYWLRCPMSILTDFTFAIALYAGFVRNPDTGAIHERTRKEMPSTRHEAPAKGR